MKVWFLILIWLIFSIEVFAQTDSTISIEKGEWDFNNKVYKLDYPPLFFQSPIAIPDKHIVDSTLSLTINNYLLVKDKHYTYNSEDGLLYFNIKIKEEDEIYIYYRAISANIKTVYSLDSITVFKPNKDSKNQELSPEHLQKKKQKNSLDIVKGTSTLSFDFDKTGFNMNRYIDLSIEGTHNDSINIKGHIYDENMQDRYMYEKELKDVQDIQIKVDNGHGYFIGGDYLQEDTSMIFYTNRELRGVKAEYRGKILSANYRANAFIGAESEVTKTEKIDLVYGVKGPYEIAEKNYLIEEISVKFNGKQLERGKDFTFDEAKGYIYLTFYFDPGSYIEVEYATTEDNIGRSLGGGLISLQKDFFYIENSVNKGFGGVDKDEIIEYLPGDTLAVISGEEKVDYNSVVYGAYKKTSTGEFKFYTKDKLSANDTLYLLYFYERGLAGHYQIDEIETYKSNGVMEVYKYDPYSSYSKYEIGKVVRIKDDFIGVNTKIGLTADSIVNLDVAKAELIKNKSVYHALFAHFDVSLNRLKLKRRDLPFQKLYFGNNLYYKQKDYYTINNFRDYSFYNNNWEFSDFEHDLINTTILSFQKDEFENVAIFSMDFKKFNFNLSPGYLSLGDFSSSKDKGAKFKVAKFNSNANLSITKKIKLHGGFNYYKYNNWEGEYNKENADLSLVLQEKTYTINPFFNYKQNDLNKKDSTFYRNHSGINLSKQFNEYFSAKATIESYQDYIKRDYIHFEEKTDTLSINQALTSFFWKDSLNTISLLLDFFNDQILDETYANYNLDFLRATKNYTITTLFNNNTELLENSIYQHVFVGDYNGSYIYDEDKKEFIFVGENMGDVELYEETSLAGKTTSKRFMASLETDYLVSPFGKIDMLEISNKKNLFPKLPNYNDIMSRSHLETSYIFGLAIFDEEDELKIYHKSGESFKRYLIFENDTSYYDSKFSLLYNIEEGNFVSKKFTSNNFSTTVDFCDKDKMAIEFNSTPDTSYIINVVNLGYETIYSLNNFADIFFGNSAELNREVSVDDKYEILYTTLGTSLYFKMLTLSIDNEISYRFGGNDNLDIPMYFNTYKKGFNYDLILSGNSQITKKLNFQLQSLTRIRKGEEPWFQVVLNGSYSF